MMSYWCNVFMNMKQILVNAYYRWAHMDEVDALESTLEEAKKMV